MVDTKVYKWIYDIETYPNCFTFSIVREDGKHKKTFEISFRKNQIDGLFKCLNYLKDEELYAVGFNNIQFDYPVLHKLIGLMLSDKMPVNGATIAKRVYKFAQEQIESFKGDGFGNTVKTDEQYFKQLDLFKIHHFDNKAKSTSLKMLEFNMRENNIEDLPFPVGMELNSEQIDVLLQYNEHDVEMTRVFYIKSIPLIELREQLSHKYNRDFMNHNDTKIGKDYFIMRLEEAGVPVYKMVDGKRKMNQTKRDVINLGECLFDYYDFKRPEFIAIKNWFAKQRIRETKGVFSDIEEHLLGDVAQYAEMSLKQKKFKSAPTKTEYDAFLREHPKGWVEEVKLAATEWLLDEQGNHVTETFYDAKGKQKTRKVRVNKTSYYGCWRIAETLNVVVNGFRFDFGVGGIHGSLSSKAIKDNKTYMIRDADVASMYPNIAISNNCYPLHLTKKFCEIYKDVYEQRKSFAKGSAENGVMKLALNGVYGDSNNQYSPFYDPAYTMKITINGQLSLCLLAEKLLEIEGLKIAQVNTDGITVAMRRDTEEQYMEICEAWQKQVGLELEYADYSAMWIRDVNNYIAQYTNGKLKNKGAYEYKDLGWHKNASCLVVPMAAEANMVFGKDVREFISEHTEKFDFMLRTKVPRSSRLVLVHDGFDVLQQNICRYYPCKDGGKLVKIMPPLEDGGEERRLGIDTEWNVKTCNNMLDFADDIDYDYYVSEVEKLIIK